MVQGSFSIHPQILDLKQKRIHIVIYWIEINVLYTETDLGHIIHRNFHRLFDVGELVIFDFVFVLDFEIDASQENIV